MTTHTATLNTLSGALWPTHNWVRTTVLLAVAVALLTISAKIKIPFYPVPLTMQTFMVLALGMVYGSRLGASAVIAYLVLGAFGLPVFAGTPEKGLGIAYMMGPTGGYLLGFLIAAAACGWLGEKGWDKRMTTTFAAMLVGNALIYVPGLIWLGAVVGWDKPVLEWGLIPFVWGDLLKIALAMIVLPLAWKLAKK